MIENDNDSTAEASASGDLYSPFLIGVGLLFGVMAWQLEPAGMMNKRDIGPHVVPLLLAVAITVAGIGRMLVGLVRQPDPQGKPGKAIDSSLRVVVRLPANTTVVQGSEDRLAAEQRQPLWAVYAYIIIAAMVLWAMLMPYLGFVASGMVFAVAMLLLMGAEVVPALAASAVMIPAAHVLFVELFHVVLPMGPWGF